MHPVGRGKGSSGAGACRRPTGAPPTVRTRLPGPAQGPWLRHLPLLITALPTHCQLLNSDRQMGRRLSPAGDDGKRGPQGQARSDGKAGQSTKPGKAVGCEVSPAALEAGDPQVALWNQSGVRAGPGAPPTERGHQTPKKRVFTVVPPVSAETKSHGRGSFKKIDRVGQEPSAEPSAALTCRRCRLWPGADARPGKQCGSSEPEPQSRSRPRSGLWRSSEAGTNGEGRGRHLLSRSGKRQGKGTRNALHGLSKLQTHR